MNVGQHYTAMFRFCRTPIKCRCANSLRSKWSKLVLTAAVLLTVILLVRQSYRPYPTRWSADSDHSNHRFKTFFNFTRTGRTKPTILLWSTTHFVGDDWFESNKQILNTECPKDIQCEITMDKNALTRSDAVVFHLQDTSWKRFHTNIIAKDVKAGRFTFKYRFPDRRTRNQVWVLFNWEPKVKIWHDFTQWDGLFNWTYMYTADSDVVDQYGRLTALSEDERLDTIKTGAVRGRNWMAGKDRLMLSMISNCHDAARRYRIRTELSRYIDIDMVGSCGANCVGCDEHINKYKFYLAFENSDCKDYLTEKFWGSLGREQIPVVAWQLSMKHLAPPHSYINVNDFPSLEDAAEYIKQVARNESLYNSYFYWRESYRLGGEHHMCQLCRKLTTGGQRGQVYTDLTGWLANDSSLCPLESMSTWAQQLWDKFTFDTGF